ncbi:hypothetical protein YB2330_002494 [Saitoella coloradoensis]
MPGDNTESKDTEEKLETKIGGDGDDEALTAVGAFGEIDIPRRTHSTPGVPEADRVLEGIYVGLAFDNEQDGMMKWGIHVTDPYGLVTQGEEEIDLKQYKDGERVRKAVGALLELSTKWSQTRGYKILGICLGLPKDKYEEFSARGENNPAMIAASEYWFSDLDATPYVIKLDSFEDLVDGAGEANRACVNFFTPSVPGNIPKVGVDEKHNEVEIDAAGKCHLLNLRHYKEITHPDYWKALCESSDTVKDRKLRIAFFSATPQGGGVALMRHAALRLLKLLGVDAHWYVPKPRPAVFDITKRKFHNVLQGVVPDNEKSRLTDKDKKIWLDWNKDNFEALWNEDDGPVVQSDLIIIDDPQLCGTIPMMKKKNPKARIIYRSHIEINNELVEKDGSHAQKCWNFLYQFIQEADLFISHPVAGFIPPNVSKDSVLLIPASTDPLDGLNKPLSARMNKYYQTVFNRICVDQGSPRLGEGRPYFIQVARFDPSKGIPDCIDAYKQFRENLKEANFGAGKHSPEIQKMTPQLVICGHSSIDDPDGSIVFQRAVQQLEKKKYRDVAPDICVVRLSSSDQLLNALMRDSLAALQLSHREGFEIKVTEALAKGKPVICYKSGGLPLQIDDHKTGFVIDRGDVASVAKAMTALVIKDGYLKGFEETILNDHYDLFRQEFYTPTAITHYLYLADKLCWKDEETFSKTGKGKRSLEKDEGVVLGDGSTLKMGARHCKELWAEEYGLKFEEKGEKVAPTNSSRIAEGGVSQDKDGGEKKKEALF